MAVVKAETKRARQEGAQLKTSLDSEEEHRRKLGASNEDEGIGRRAEEGPLYALQEAGEGREGGGKTYRKAKAGLVMLRKKRKKYGVSSACGFTNWGGILKRIPSLDIYTGSTGKNDKKATGGELRRDYLKTNSGKREKKRYKGFTIKKKS